MPRLNVSRPCVEYKRFHSLFQDPFNPLRFSNVSDYGSEGWGFEFLPVRQPTNPPTAAHPGGCFVAEGLGPPISRKRKGMPGTACAALLVHLILVVVRLYASMYLCA